MTEDLNKLSVEDLGMLFPIVLTEYNPEWRNKFLAEKELLLDSLKTVKIIGIEHIGSTAIPGLIAKPTIDILLEIKDGADISHMTEQLKRIGYNSIPKPENPPPHLMFVKGYSITGYCGQKYHIHIRYLGDWDELVFRDYLVRNPDVVQLYAGLKKRLSVSYKNDREKYTDAKTDFIKDIIQRARKELDNLP
jgi:GrpB-like predicted nucleotidyltransferase (UPF0157 family)